MKVDVGERRKTLKIRLKRTRDRGGVESTRLEAKGTKQYPSQRQPLQGQTLFRARTQVQVFSKKKTIIIRSSEIFFTRFKKKGLQNFFQVISKKTNFSTEKDLQNFKNSKHNAVLEPRTVQFLST